MGPGGEGNQESSETLLLTRIQLGSLIGGGVFVAAGLTFYMVKWFRTEENERVIFLRELSGAIRTIPKPNIKSITYSPVSLMPQGLLNGLEDGGLQDIFAYLRSTTPPF